MAVSPSKGLRGGRLMGAPRAPLAPAIHDREPYERLEPRPRDAPGPQTKL